MKVDNTINSVIDNLTKTVNPAIESITTISQTLVQETATAGFMYVMMGCGLIITGFVLAICFIWAHRRIKEKEFRGNVMAGFMIAAIISIITGFFISLASISSWVAPTRQITRELMKNPL